jgi:membrane protease YdiL (CAAX protease family)
MSIFLNRKKQTLIKTNNLAHNFRLSQAFIVFLMASLWVIVAIGAIKYFGWYSIFSPELLIHTGIIFVCAGCTAVFFKPLKITYLFDTLGFRKSNLRYYLVAIIIAVFFWIADFWLQSYYFLDDGTKDGISLQRDIQQFGSISMVLAICFLAPLAEEILFRGILLKGLVNTLSPQWAILLSSMLFAAIHFSQNDTLTLFVVAVGYSMLTLKARSIWPAILAHVTNNSVTLYYLTTI